MAASVEDVSELAPAQQPRRGSQLSQRSGKISLPAKISDLYQTYPGDGEGMVQVGVLYCTVLYYCIVLVPDLPRGRRGHGPGRCQSEPLLTLYMRLLSFSIEI